jgi:hypothetical protein
MDETTPATPNTPTTPANGDATPRPLPGGNGPAPEARPALTGMQFRPLPPDPKTGEIFLECGPEAAAYFDDMAWVEEGFETGRFDAYRDRYIAVVNRAVIGHGDRPDTLRDEMARQHGVHPGRILIDYVPPEFVC